MGRYRLRDLGELRTGFQLRGAAKNDPEGRHPVIQLGDVRDDGIDFERLVRMNLGILDVLVPGDILLRSRGASYRAAVVPTDCPPEAVAAAPLYVFGTQATLFPVVLPEYLVWYINRPDTQAILAGVAHGSSILTVGVRAFGDLEVVVPPLDEQRRIVEVAALLREERKLTERLLDRRQELARSLLESQLRKSER